MSKSIAPPPVPLRTPVKIRTSAVVALLGDAGAWLMFVLGLVSMGDDAWAAAGALMAAFFVAGCAALVALIGIGVGAIVARHRRELVEPNIRLGLIALYASVMSTVIFWAVLVVLAE